LKLTNNESCAVKNFFKRFLKVNLSTLTFSFGLEWVIKKVEENQEGVEWDTSA